MKTMWMEWFGRVVPHHPDKNRLDQGYEESERQVANQLSILFFCKTMRAFYTNESLNLKTSDPNSFSMSVFLE
jgi:hypothetical protein